MSDVSVASSTPTTPRPPKRRLRILSVDGGGIRGIIPLMVLAELERRVQAVHGKALHEVFDFFTGTSTGGMIVSALCARSADGSVQPATAQDVLNDYVDHGADIFPWKVDDKLSTGWGFLRRKYSHKPLVEMIKSRIGDARLRDTAVELLLTSYDLHGARPYFFKRWRAQQDSAKRDHPLWEAVRSTSAAPTYFEPHNLVGRDDTGRELYNRCLVDGGLIANNPAMCAWAEAQKMLQVFPVDPDGPRAHLPFNPMDRDRVLLVSLGTGDGDALRDGSGVDATTRRYQYGKVRKWWIAPWAKAAISVSMDGVSDTVEHELARVLIGAADVRAIEEAGGSVDQDYFRFQTHLTKATEPMDMANEITIPELQDLGHKLVQRESAQIDKLVAMLAP